MIYKFKTPASGDVIMLGAHGDQMLRLLGRDPAPQGIIEVQDVAGAMAALEAAISPASSPAPAGPRPADSADATGAEREPAVELRQRLWPMIEMLRRAQAAGAAVVWGV